MIGKRGRSYRGIGSSEVHTLINEKIDHGTFLETVLLLAKYDSILKCRLDQGSSNWGFRPLGGSRKGSMGVAGF